MEYRAELGVGGEPVVLARQESPEAFAEELQNGEWVQSTYATDIMNPYYSGFTTLEMTEEEALQQFEF
jgi:hypothetical protein